jgi:uncharacterized Zn finger protein (UPF0148 family)
MSEVTVSSESFKCPSCGADMTFDPKSGMLSCAFCDHKDEICTTNEEIEEYDFNSAETDTSLNDWGAKTKTISCDNCGGKTVVPADETTVKCAFCGSAKVISTDELPGIRPESLIPFKIDNNRALGLFKDWIKKRRMAPFALKKEYSTGGLKGVYIPYWSYDTNTHSSYTGQAGDYYYVTEMRTVTVNGKTEMQPHRVQKTRWRFVSGTYDKSFDDIIFNDSGRVDQKIIEKIEPFHLNELVKYNPKFLAGFAAERYKNGLKAVWERAKAFINKTIRNDIYAIIKRGCDVVGTINICTTYDDIKYKHMLLPVWISSYTFKGKIYNFFINGQTGEVQGRSPKSALKIAGLVLIGIAIAAILYFVLR